MRGFRPRTRSTRTFAVAGACMMPELEWPAAHRKPAAARGSGPIMGKASGEAGRSPVQMSSMACSMIPGRTVLTTPAR